ncbi:MAG: hypothetical protein ACKVS6_14820 [Planctomycetota bacterium]
MSLYQTFKKMQSGPIMIGIAVFGLLTFTITGAMLSTVAGDPRHEKAMEATMPSGKKVTFTQNDRMLAHSIYKIFYESNPREGKPIERLVYALIQQSQGGNFQKIFSQLGKVTSWSGKHMRSSQGMTKEEREKANDPIMQIMLVNALGRDQGLEAGIGEVKEWVEEVFSSAEQYRRGVMAVLGLDVKQFEWVLREAILFRRTMDIVLAQTPIPSGDDIVNEWCRRNERLTFEIAAFSVADRKAKMDPAKIIDEELKKFLDQMKEGEKDKYKEPEKLQLEGLAVTDPNAKFNDAFQALLTSVVVEPNDVQAFFDMSRLDRYKKPASAPAVPDTNPSSIPLVEYFSFDEAKNRAAEEVKIARALDKVRIEAMDASNKPEFDLKKIGEKYGLTHWTSGEPKTEADVIKIDIYGTVTWRAPLETAKEGEFLPGTQASAGAIQFTRVVKKVAPRIPELTDIRGRVATDYIEEKAEEQTRDEANRFKDAVAAATGDDRFSKTGKERGVDTKILAPISRDRRNDPDFATETDTKNPSHFLPTLHFVDSLQPANSRTDPFLLKKDAVGGPYYDTTNKIYYIVRLVDSVTPTVKDMWAVDYLPFRDRFMKELREKKCMEIMSSESLQKQLKIDFDMKKETAKS